VSEKCCKVNWPDEDCLECKHWHIKEGWAWNPYAVVHCFNKNETKYGVPKKRKDTDVSPDYTGHCIGGLNDR
jgi:hypothetical protein